MTSAPVSTLPRGKRIARGLAPGVACLGVLTLAGCTPSSPSTPGSTPQSTETATPSPHAPVYADGTYSART